MRRQAPSFLLFLVSAATLCLLQQQETVNPSASSRTAYLSNQQVKLEDRRPTHVRHWWTNSSEPVLPLVDPFDGEVNPSTNEPIFYDPKVGYSFPNNGQGGKWSNRFYTPDVLKYKLEPDHVFSKQEGIQCLKQHNIQWLHIDGDSLARDVFYDFAELFGKLWSSKEKTLADQRFDGENVTMTFSGAAHVYRETPAWYHHSLVPNNKACPDLWIYSTGLWDHPQETSFEDYRNRTKAIADFDHSCVTHKILRYTTPRQKQSRDPRKYVWNEKTKGYNRIATELLVPVGFRYVDTYEFLDSRDDLTKDGIHYTGAGSKWVTNSILSLVC